MPLGWLAGEREDTTLVLDAFEIVLVVVPLLLPPVLTVVPDALWMAAVILLVLQGSFMVPPFGYAVMLARGMAPEPVPMSRTSGSAMSGSVSSSAS